MTLSASQNSLLFSFINTYIFNQHLNHMFILSVSRPSSSALVQPSHFVLWTRFMRVFSCLLWVSLCPDSTWQPPTYPSSLLMALWSLYSHIFPTSAADVSEACSDTGSSRSHSFHLPSLPTKGCYFLIHALLSVWLHSGWDITKTWASSQRSGKGQKGKPAVGDPQFDTAAKGSQLQPGAWAAWAACCIPWLKEKDIALPTTEIQKSHLDSSSFIKF